MLEKLQKIISILGTFIILNGTLYLYIYYSQFGINIFSYLDFTEVLTAFLHYLPNILYFFGIYLLHLFFPLLLLDKLANWLKNKFPSFNDANNKGRILKGLNIGFWIQVILLITFFILVWVNFWELNGVLIYIFVFLSMNIIQRLVDFFEKNINNITGEKFYDPFFQFIVVALPFTAFTIVLAFHSADTIKKNSQTITLIDNADKVSFYNDNFKLIGKTNNYIFLYNSGSIESLTISLKDIKTIQYH
jgi:hypothetical protein